MHKLLKIIPAVAVLTLLFGATLPARAEETSVLGSAAKTAANWWVQGALAPITIANEAAKAISGSSLPELALKKTLDVGSGIGSSFLGWVSIKAIGYVLFVLSYIAGFIGSTAFTLAGLFVEFGLYLNTTILDGEVVQLGWRFCRDLANLGFTIGIVVIAYATMLGVESYGMKKLIKNFIVAAVMVNFSFSLAGFAIDMSNMLTHFFVNASIGGGAGEVGIDSIHKFTETLASAFSPQKLLVTDSGNFEVYKSLSEDDGIIAAVLAIFFVALFTAFAALGMLMVGLTTISRFVYLSGLIILMPLAILCYAFPNTEKHYKKWYEQFTCQLTYLPTATFTMYIIIMFVQVKSNIGYGNAQAIDLKNLLDNFEAAKGAPGGLTSTRTLALMAAPFRTITDMILVLTMLFYGITKSRNVGCAGGKIALEWMTGLGDWAVGKSQGGGVYGWAGRKYLSGGGDGTKENNRGNRLAGFLQRIPLISRFAPQINKFTAGTSKNLGNLETEAKGMGDVQLRNAIYNPDIKLSSERMAAFAKEAVSRGLLNNSDTEKNISQEKLDEFIPALKRYGFDKEILKKAPHLYGKFGLNIEKNDKDEYINKEDGKKFDDAIKAFKPEDGDDLPVEALEDIEVVRRLSGDQLQKLPKSEKHRAAFTSTVLRLREKIGSTEFDKYMGKTFSKAEVADALTPELLTNKDVVRNLNNAHLKRISSPDKKKQRDAFIETLNRKDATTGEYELDEKDLVEFTKKNFTKGKDIAEIHPDILRNERVFSKLQGSHIAYLQTEPDTEQQLAIIKTLRKEYLANASSAYEKNGVYSKTKAAHLDELAATIVKNKDNPVWSMVDTAEAKEDFIAIENEYRSRHPDENPKKKDIDQKEKKAKSDDIDPYGPSAPKPPTQGPYPPAGGGPSSGNTPSKPPLPPVIPKGPYPAGAGGPSTATPPKPTPLTKVKINPEPSQAQKAIDIGEVMDGILGGRKGDEVISPTPRQEKQNMNEVGELDSIQPEPIGTPITPPELDALAKSEAERLNQKEKKIIEPKPEGGGWQPPEPIDAEWEPKNKLEYKGSPVPPEQKPTSVPEPIKTIVERERNANENQISVIPKFMPADQPKRITYQGPVTPPPTPAIPEPIRSFLREEKEKKDNQERGQNTV